MKRLLLATSLTLWAAAPAEAAVLPGADFQPGTTLGAGIMGLSADYAIGDWSLGLAGRQNATGQMTWLGRGLVRFLETPEDHAAVVVGALYDPALLGGPLVGRSYLVPDVGLSLSHRFSMGDITFANIPLGGMPVIVRAAVTLTTAEQRPMFAPPSQPQPLGNFFQRLALGPNSQIGLAIRPSENVELTVGSGTIAGVRVNF